MFKSKMSRTRNLSLTKLLPKTVFISVTGSRIFALYSRGTVLLKQASMRVCFFILLIIPFTQVFAQSDTVIVFYDRGGNVCEQNDATKFALQIKEGDHYKKLKGDMMDSKVESIAYFTDSECKNFDGLYKELYKN